MVNATIRFLDIGRRTRRRVTGQMKGTKMAKSHGEWERLLHEEGGGRDYRG